MNTLHTDKRTELVNNLEVLTFNYFEISFRYDFYCIFYNIMVMDFYNLLFHYSQWQICYLIIIICFVLFMLDILY